jgi:hypothetical protein
MDIETYWNGKCLSVFANATTYVCNLRDWTFQALSDFFCCFCLAFYGSFELTRGNELSVCAILRIVRVFSLCDSTISVSDGSLRAPSRVPTPPLLKVT